MAVRRQAADPSGVPPTAQKIAALAPVVIQTKGSNCKDQWTLYGQYQEAMRDYARMSFIVYAGEAPRLRSEEYVTVLRQRSAAGRADVKLWLNGEIEGAQGVRDELIVRAARRAPPRTDRRRIYRTS